MTHTVYVDTSVVLARVQREGRKPPSDFFDQHLIASRLVEYEAWTRINSAKLGSFLGGVLEATLDRISFVELAPPVLRFAKEPWPASIRTLDALHLSTLRYLLGEGMDVRLATFDANMLNVAQRLKLPVVPL